MKPETSELILRWIQLAVKLRKAKDEGTGITLNAQETKDLLEMLHTLKAGPPHGRPG